MSELAPIVITAFKRPEHLKTTLESLAKNDFADRSTLYIFCDGPRVGETSENLVQINRVREVAKRRNYCRNVEVFESDFNLGLVRSFLKAINFAIERHGKVIVLEDDQQTSVGFLKFMNEALCLYEDDEQVMHVSGYMYPADFTAPSSTFFLNVQSCPGWATWARAWKYYNHDANGHCEEIGSSRRAIRHFDIGWAKWYAQLKRNCDQPGFSFAVRWYASCYRRGGLSLFPAKSLVKNIGIDGSGEHCAPSKIYDVEPADYVPLRREPIVENMVIRNAIGRHYRSYHRRTIRQLSKEELRKLKGRIRGLMRAPLLWMFPEIRRQVQDGVTVLENCEVSPKAKLIGPGKMANVQIGDYSYISKGATISFAEIGKFSSIGPNFNCGWGIHPLSGLSTSPTFYSVEGQNGFVLSMSNKVVERKIITIGNDVFIGMNVTVLDGVTIGDGAVVGAGCVVSKDVPPYAVVVGSPMKILRYRFDEETRAKLLKSNWWNWSDEKLSLVEEHFFNVEEFMRHCDSKI